MAPPLGLIITVSVIVAAGLAAYENPQVREWIDRSRQKIAMALYSLGDDINPQSRSPRRDDPSTREEMTEMAEARRRQARAEIMERGRILEEKRRAKEANRSNSGRSGSSHTHADENRTPQPDLKSADSRAWSTSIDTHGPESGLANRHVEQVLVPGAANLHDSVDSPMALRQLGVNDQMQQSQTDPFADHYEQEMRNAWNITLPQAPSSHASESLIDLTPTSELAPDPGISLPSSSHLQHPLDRSEYFSAPASTSSHTLSDEDPDFYYAHPENPFAAVSSQSVHPSRPEIAISVSSAPSVAGSTDHVHRSDLEESDDGVMSEFGDGVRTPASLWTDVGSVVSNED